MNNLPKVTPANQTGRSGVTVLQGYIEKKGWIFRRQDGETDFGVDAEIELVSNNLVTGHLFKAQIKSAKAINWSGSEAVIQVKTSTFNLWQKLPLLMVLFLVEVSSGEIFWTPALAHHPRPDSDSLSIKFEQASSLSKGGMERLESYLASWFSAFDNAAIQDEVPFYHTVYREHFPVIDQYDPWTTMGEDELNIFQRFYGYVKRLRLHMGLDNQGIPSLEDWYTRDAEMWDGGCGEFYRATFSEALAIITPYYEEAFERLVERLEKVEMDHSNQTIKRYIAQIYNKDSHDAKTYFSHSSIGPELHYQLEKRLEAVGGLRGRYDNKQKKIKSD